MAGAIAYKLDAALSHYESLISYLVIPLVYLLI